jgi:hypothetical protein
MGRIMNTYPVSEPEMEHISSLSAQAIVRYSIASLLFGLSTSIWINATFYLELTPAADMATKYIAPFLLIFSTGFAGGGIWAQWKRKSAWERIKTESNPIEAVAPPAQLVVSSAVGTGVSGVR